MADRFKNWKKPVIKEMKPTKYGWMVQHVKNLDLGYKTDIGAFSYLNAFSGIVIEDYAQIGSHYSIYSFSSIGEKNAKVVLKKNCKIGAHSTVMPGVTVGENSIIGAHSFVDKSMPNNVLAFGVPAKIIKKLN